MKSLIKRMFPVFDTRRRTWRQDEVKYHVVAKNLEQAQKFIERNQFERHRFRYVQSPTDLNQIFNVTVILLPGWTQRADYPQIVHVLGTCAYRNVKIVKVEDFIASLN
jgi:hypothetical protein